MSIRKTKNCGVLFPFAGHFPRLCGDPPRKGPQGVLPVRTRMKRLIQAFLHRGAPSLRPGPKLDLVEFAVSGDGAPRPFSQQL
jgi:hypothetical protein